MAIFSLLVSCGETERDGNANETGGEPPDSGNAGGAGRLGVGGALAGRSSGGTSGAAGRDAAGAAGQAATGGAEAGTAAGGAGNAGPAGASGAAGDSGDCNEYLACGCGCCIPEPAEVSRCYYPELGDSLDAVISADRTRASDPGCVNAGCSLGVRYACCLQGPAATTATYTALATIGAYDRVNITKQDDEGNCARFTLTAPGPGDERFRIELPERSFLERASHGLCTMSSIGPNAIGALGDVRLRQVGDECRVDTHVTLFFSDSSGGVDRVRFDFDDLLLTGDSSLCTP